MSIQAQINALEDLASLDAELAALEKEIEQERSALGEKRTHLQGLEAKLDSTETSVAEMERVRNELIAEARQMSVQMERSRDKLNRCRTEREVNAAQREVEELRKLYKDREHEIQKLGNLVDQARGEIDTTTEERNSIAGDLGDSAGAVETRLGQLEQDSADKRARRAELAKRVPPVLFRRYDMIRQRRGSGICHTSSGTCSACHISLAPMMFQVLRRGEGFDQCPSCNRIIYFRPAVDLAESDATAEESSSSASTAGSAEA